MPRVLRIINRFNLGGPTYNAAYLSRYLSSDYETLLVGGEKMDSEDSSTFILDQLNLDPVIIPEMRREINPIQDYIAYKKLKKLIKEFKPDIVHTHASKAGTLGRLAAHRMNVPVVLHTFHGHVFHSYFNKTKTDLFKKIERYLADRSSRIIAISDIQKNELGDIHKICSPEKIEVVPLGFDLGRFQENLDTKRHSFREEYGIADDEIAIAIIGRLVPIKNHRLFFKAFKHVLENTSKKVKAVVVGDGECRQQCEEIASEMEIPFSTPEKKNPEARMIFTSWIKDVDRVNAGVDIVALSSLNEGTPVSLIEAQAANNPVVSTRVGGIENVVSENVTGLLADVEDEETYGNNLLKLVEDDQLRKSMTDKGWPHVRENFHYERLVKDIHQLYNKLLKENEK